MSCRKVRRCRALARFGTTFYFIINLHLSPTAICPRPRQCLVIARPRRSVDLVLFCHGRISNLIRNPLSNANGVWQSHVSEGEIWAINSSVEIAF